jgi:putative transposase
MELGEFIGHLGKASVADVGAVFQEYLRAQARMVFMNAMEAEVEMLCGPAYRATGAHDCRRAGSAPGFFYDGTQRVETRRPRVRRRGAASVEEEASLATYQAGRTPGELQRMMLAAIRAGVSSRDVGEMHDDAPGTSASVSSRIWVRESAKALAAFRARDLTRPDWLVLMLDGIRLGDDLWAIVALGIRATGEKMLLDFELGATEDQQVADALLTRIKTRGFTPAAKSLLAVLDGAKALANAVANHFSHAVIQRCLVHKERNLRSYLSRKCYGELARIFKRLRRVQGSQAAAEVMAELKTFVGSKNKQALESVEEAGDQLTALHGLEVPSTLHVSLLSTNCIENPLRNTRAKTRRVTRWRGETTQPARWLAYAFQKAEKGFRRIRGHQDLAALRDALDRHGKESAKKIAMETKQPITEERRIDSVRCCA